ncbi:putative RiPP precursor [Mesorhizobium sp. USDA-HM6]|nr:putative RiPP precursor [Mesorhizobium sp. USDA-HM6]
MKKIYEKPTLARKGKLSAVVAAVSSTPVPG